MKAIGKTINDRWSWRGFIPTAADAAGTSCLSYQLRTDEIMNRKVGLTKKDKIICIVAGICGAVALWGSIILLYAGFTMLGGE